MNLLSPLMLAQQAFEGLQVAQPLDPSLSGTLWMPVQASTIAPEIDWIFYYIYWISVFFTALIVGVMIFFVMRYRHRKGVWDGEKSASHGVLLEITWSVIPFLLTIVMWWKGIDTFMHAETVPPPGQSLEIKVTGRQWMWNFKYDNGLSLDNELHIPAGEPVTFIMKSDDVIHSFSVPAWRVKKDVVPGRYTKVWVDATIPGEFALFCTEYCGLDHSRMLSRVVVHPTEDMMDDLRAKGVDLTGVQTFEDWYEQASEDFLKIYEGMTPEEIGETVYTAKACLACHSTDGSARVGPSWKGIWGTQEEMEDGSIVTVDENYIRESILDPNAKWVKGYKGGMTSYQGMVTDEEIDGIIAYIKSLAD